MAKNAIQYPVQILRDAKRDVLAGIDNLSNKEIIGVSAVLGLAVVFAPHVLALNGAISLIGSCGRASQSNKQEVEAAAKANLNGQRHVACDGTVIATDVSMIEF